MYLSKIQKKWDKNGIDHPFWELLTEQNKKNNKGDEFNRFFNEGIKEIEDIIKEIKLQKLKFKKELALDFGCGAGRCTQALTKYFKKVIGVDIAPSMIKHANNFNKYPKKCKYYLNTKKDLSMFKDNKFDLIYSNQTLQHIQPKYVKKYLKEFIRIVKPNGVVIFQLPSGLNFDFKDKSFRYKINLVINYIVGQKIWNFIILTLNKIFSKKEKFEIYYISKANIIKILKKNKTKIIKIKENKLKRLPKWKSATYFLTK